MIERKTFLYEILWRGGPDGFVGAHAIDLERISDGEEIINERQLDPRPITEDEFASLLGSESVSMVEAADAARAERDQALAARDAALGEAEADRAEARRAREEAAALVEAARVEVAAAKAEVASFLRAQAEAAVRAADNAEAAIPAPQPAGDPA